MKQPIKKERPPRKPKPSITAHVKQEDLMSILKTTSLEFDTALFYQLVNKMPTAYLRMLIEEQFYGVFRQGPHWLLTDTNTNECWRFCTFREVVEFCEENDITSKRTLEKLRWNLLKHKRSRDGLTLEYVTYE